MVFEEPKVEFVELSSLDVTTTSCANNTVPGLETCIGSEVDPKDECANCASGAGEMF